MKSPNKEAQDAFADFIEPQVRQMIESGPSGTKVTLLEREEEVLALKCPNCAAPASGTECKYCGSFLILPTNYLPTLTSMSTGIYSGEMIVSGCAPCTGRVWWAESNTTGPK